MKYLLVIDHIQGGGAERILLDYYNHLVACGQEAKIFTITGTVDGSKWTKGIEVCYGSSADEDNLQKKALQQLTVYRKFKSLVKEYQPDVIFSFLEKSNLLTSMVHSKATKVMTVHNVLSIQYTKVHNPAVRKMVYGMIRRAYNKCSRVVAVSKQVKDDLVASFGVEANNIHIINNYVDHDDIARKAKEAVGNYCFVTDKKYVLNIGRFSDQKAQWKLLKAFSLLTQRHDDARLVLVGAGENLAELEALRDNLQLGDKAVFLPFSLNPYKYMAKADLFALSSTFEGFPIVLAEVSSLRVPFVGSEKAVPEEMFADKAVWQQYIFKSENICDFSTTIHDDERQLSLLLEKGLYDATYRQQLLDQTSGWESHNDKEWQFKAYDEMINMKS